MKRLWVTPTRVEVIQAALPVPRTLAAIRRRAVVLGLLRPEGWKAESLRLNRQTGRGRYRGCSLWNDERDALVEAAWPTWEDASSILARLRALGCARSIDERHIAHRARSLGARRPEGWRSRKMLEQRARGQFNGGKRT